MSLVVENVVSGYGKVDIVRDISLTVDNGEFVTIIGPNGSGKSTLMKTIFGLVTAWSGDIRFNGKTITTQSPDRIARQGIGYVPQLENVFPTLTVLENLEMGMFLHRQRSKKREDLQADLDFVYNLFPILKERKKERARTLSGGERQMLAMARAIIGKPQLLMLDEPTAALAPNLVDQILNTISEIRKRGISILLIEQNARKSLAISDRAYVLAVGRMVHSGEAKSLLESSEIRRHYLGERKATV